MKQAPFLKKGDTVGILSTARKISLDEIQFAVETLENWGLHVRTGKTINAEENQFAGNDELRKADLQEMLDDDNIKAILCARGGYGTVRTMDELDFSSFLKKPKWLVGYSDITYLHTLINTKYKFQTIHATMPVNFRTNTEESLSSLRKALFGDPISYIWDANPLNHIGNTSAEIVGGNLSILYSLTGTNPGFDTNGKILFIEDLDEYLYHLDRMMWNLHRSGKLNNIQALLVGGMTDMNDNQIPFGKGGNEIIAEMMTNLQKPVAFSCPFGHIKNNLALILGRKCKVTIGKDEVSLSYS